MNWLIDRWNFCRYVAQVFQNTVDSWPATVGIWHTDDNDIAAVVNSEGENRGEAFIQFGKYEFSDKQVNEFLDHAEKYFPVQDDQGRYINLRVPPNNSQLINLIAKRNYKKQG